MSGQAAVLHRPIVRVGTVTQMLGTLLTATHSYVTDRETVAQTSFTNIPLFQMQKLNLLLTDILLISLLSGYLY